MSNLKLPNFEYEGMKSMLLDTKNRYKTVAYKTYAFYQTNIARYVEKSEKYPYGVDREQRVDYVVIHHHDNCIAEIGPDHIYVTNAGWASKTTAQRLNAILRDNGYPYTIRIKNYDMVITDSEGNTESFSSAVFEKEK